MQKCYIRFCCTMPDNVDVPLHNTLFFVIRCLVISCAHCPNTPFTLLTFPDVYVCGLLKISDCIDVESTCVVRVTVHFCLKAFVVIVFSGSLLSKQYNFRRFANLLGKF